jgi:hypothetical protein
MAYLAALKFAATGGPAGAIYRALNPAPVDVSGAVDARDLKLADNIRAERQESTAEKMADRAARLAEQQRDLRADANRPFRPRWSVLESEI